MLRHCEQHNGEITMRNLAHTIWLFLCLPALAETTGDSIILRDLSGLYPGANQPSVHDIVNISDVVDGVLIVAFNPLIREVPNVLVYQVTSDGLERAMEGLALGIEMRTTSRVDLHTQGVAVDMSVDRPEEAFALLEDFSFQGINYGRFVHLHPLGETRFILDKTMFEELRTSLLDPEGWYLEGEAVNTCILYDMPSLLLAELSKNDSEYIVEATTNNFQWWRVTFRGISEDGLLIDKTISAGHLAPNSE